MCGMYPPERYVFSLGFSVGSMLLAILLVINHLRNERINPPTRSKWPAELLLGLGLSSTLCLALMATVPVSEFPVGPVRMQKRAHARFLSLDARMPTSKSAHHLLFSLPWAHQHSMHARIHLAGAARAVCRVLLLAGPRISGACMRVPHSAHALERSVRALSPRTTNLGPQDTPTS